MNKDQFISLLRNPVNLNSDSVALLNDVVKEFPYFQTAHLLYTKNLYDQNSMHYSGQLKRAAAYVSDRKVLYQLINNPAKVVAVPQVIHSTVVVEEKVAFVETKPVEGLIVKHSSSQPKEFVKTTEVVKPDDIEKKDVEIVELVLEAPNTPIEIDVKKLSSLDQEILSKAIDSSIKQEVDEPFLEDKKEISKEKPVIEDVPISSDSKFSFSDWLKLSDPKTPKEDKKKLNYTEMIDKFIVHEPKMTRPAASFYSPVDKARKSVVDNFEIVTETLAKIYEKQGNYPKAIKVYESLRLKYPGKSSYFAARIQEIERLINL